VTSKRVRAFNRVFIMICPGGIGPNNGSGNSLLLNFIKAKIYVLQVIIQYVIPFMIFWCDT
jgi:hypothetical protein